MAPQHQDGKAKLKELQPFRDALEQEFAASTQKLQELLWPHVGLDHGLLKGKIGVGLGSRGVVQRTLNKVFQFLVGHGVKQFELGFGGTVLRKGFFECRIMLGVAKEVAET